MDECIVCEACKEHKFVVGTGGVRCSNCGHFITYDEEIYEILTKEQLRHKERNK